jgi:hypothetical protein
VLTLTLRRIKNQVGQSYVELRSSSVSRRTDKSSSICIHANQFMEIKNATEKLRYVNLARYIRSKNHGIRFYEIQNAEFALKRTEKL